MLKELWKKMVRKIQMYRMDRNWNFMTGACFQLLPPSFYSIYTKEKVKEVQKRMYEIIDEYGGSERE